jgi:hypothetical protein
MPSNKNPNRPEGRGIFSVKNTPEKRLHKRPAIASEGVSLTNKFLRTARKVAERDKPVFDMLMEFEKTKKIRTKTRLNFTIDKTVAMQFKKYCRNNSYNMSAKIEEAMRVAMKNDV